MGVVIKIMDDYLDADRESRLITYLSRAVLPYSLLLFLVGLTIDLRLGAALFFTAYAVGMVGRGLDGVRLPSRLSPLTESIGVLLCGAYFCGWRLLLTVGAAMVAVQALDDIIDYSADKGLGIPSWATRLGLIPAVLILAIAIGTGISLAPILTAQIIVCSRVISLLGGPMIRVGKGSSRGEY